MNGTRRLVLLSLCSMIVLMYIADSHPTDDPKDCCSLDRVYSSQHRSVCTWSFKNGVRFKTALDFLTPGKQGGKIASKKACSAGGETQCLTFWYYFTANSSIDLTVSTKYDRSDEGKSTLWTMSSSNGWERAQVPVTATRSFKVIFKAERRPGNSQSSASVCVGLISYTKSPCPHSTNEVSTTEILTTAKTTAAATAETEASTKPVTTPETTTPATAETEASTKPETTPWRTLQTTITTPASTLTLTTESVDVQHVDNSESAGPSTTPYAADSAVVDVAATEEDALNERTRASNELVIALAVFVAVLVVIVIIMAVLLVVFRRKQLQLQNKFCKNTSEELVIHCSQNSGYRLDAEDPLETNSPDKNHTRQNSDNHRLEAGATRHTQAIYSIARDTRAPPVPYHTTTEPVYAVVNKHKDRNKNPAEGQRKAATTTDKTEVRSPNGPATKTKNPTSFQASTEGKGINDIRATWMTSITSSSCDIEDSTKDYAVYHILEKDPELQDSSSVYHDPQGVVAVPTEQTLEGEYNKLDLNREKRVRGESSEDWKSAGTGGTVYNHLNEDGENTYDEIQREKRVQVFGGVYSHLVN